MKLDKRKLRVVPPKTTAKAKEGFDRWERHYAFRDALKSINEEISELIKAGYSVARIHKKITEAGFAEIHQHTLRKHLQELFPELYAKHLGRKTKVVATPAPVAPPTAQAVQATVKAQTETTPVPQPQGQQLNSLDEFKAKLFNIALTANPEINNLTALSFYENLIREQSKRFDSDGKEIMSWSINKLNMKKGFDKDLKLDAYNLIELNKALLTDRDYTCLNNYLAQIGFNK